MVCTIRDIACETGVSCATVSRILHRTEGYSYAEKTRRRVERTAKKMGYYPSLAAQLLRTRKSNLVGIAMQTSNSMAASICIELCCKAVKSLGYTPVTIDVSMKGRLSGINLLGRMNLLCGLICFYPSQEKSMVTLLEQTSSPIPVVTLKKRVTASDNVREVLSDYRTGTRQGLDHLRAAGHRRVCYVGVLRSEERKDLNERWRFFRSAARERDMEPVNIFLPGTGKASAFASGVKAAVQMLSQRDLTAAFCRNDEMAVGLVSGLFRKKVSVPEDVSVIGYDDLPYTQYMNPPLTTIRQDFEKLTRVAAKLLVDAVVAGKKPAASLPERIAVPTVLVARKSTAQARPVAARPKKT